ncbi:hypothetical protein J2Z31_001838 [Sinorhizobium kostiense]|uniref:Transmembrane protein n=1 Tax=Sinorhizobium kostiense TaxID=76747 RepID=A0ABS4QYW4_9HYPH|nr:hypothetical protein [Sinorhizobium kostiense]MBP2235346.1 hypothetical protein [Sinorhizobium kostiense]
MFEPIPVTDECKQTIVGLAVFGFAFWLTHSMFGKLGAELERVCEIIERTGDQCRTGPDLTLLFWIAVIGCVFLGYLGYRFSNFMFRPK